jgi:hypothetical protein
MDRPLREWYKRVWALMQEHDLYPGGVSGHATHSIALRALPWTDAVLDSEYPIKDAVTIYPKDAMIAMSCPHNFGVNISHLGPMKPTWASMFDAGMGGSGGVFNDVRMRHFGIAAEDVEFLPFWRNGGVIKMADEGMLASAWKRPGKVVIEVFNHGPDPEDAQKTRSARMKLDLEALGVPKGLGPGQLRVRELAIGGNRVNLRDGIFGWYEHLLERPRWRRDKAAKIRPPAAPTITMDGVVRGVHVFYHDARFLEVTWNEKRVDRAALAEEVGAGGVGDALAWGFDRAERADGFVKAEKGDVDVKAWKQPGTAMIVVHNPGAKAVTATVRADLAGLGVKVEKLWTEFTQIYEPDGNAQGFATRAGPLPAREARMVSRGTAAFMPYDGRIVARIPAGGRRVFFIDTY